MANNRQSQFRPEYYSVPGDTLLEILDEIGMTQREFAERTGLTPKTINEIVKGKAPITPETALQFERVLGAPASFWNNLESQYQEVLAREKERNMLHTFFSWLSQIPFREMAKREWINISNKDIVGQIQEILNFFGVASPQAFNNLWKFSDVKFRMSQAININQGAVAAWLRMGEIRAQEVECKPYDKIKFRKALYEIRTLTAHKPSDFIPRMEQFCSESGVALVFVRELPNTGISGATSWLTPEKALIQLSLLYKTNDVLWFSFYHEAAHILKHNKSNVYLDVTSGLEAVDNKDEQEANIFAANMLIPPKEYRNYITSYILNEDNIIWFADEIGIHPGIVVGRLQHDEKLVWRSNLNKLKMRLKWAEKS